MQGVMCSKTFLWNNNLISYMLFFYLAFTGCWFYHMTCRQFFHIFMSNEKKIILAIFWMLVVPHDLKTFIHIFMSSWNTFFPLANFWMLVVPHDLHTFSFIYMQWNIFFSCTFLRLVVPHDFKTLFIYLWAVKPIFPCTFLNIGCTTWLTDIFLYL